MDYEKAYKEALTKSKEFYELCKKCGAKDTKEFLEDVFPELQESENEKIRKGLIENFKWFCGDYPETTKWGKDDDLLVKDILAWLEKQGEKKPIMNVPTREVILAIWDLGNEWKELTNGSISTKYGTKLDYIQKHWHESEYYLREKQSENKLTFNADDWYVSNVDGKIHDMTYNPADNVEKKEETKSKQETLDNRYVEYVYILDYCSGRIIVAKHDTEESIETLFEKLGLKESQCNYMVSDKILSIEYINF